MAADPMGLLRENDPSEPHHGERGGTGAESPSDNGYISSKYLHIDLTSTR